MAGSSKSEVSISGKAAKDLGDLMRLWSRWGDSSLVFGKTDHRISDVATTHFDKRLFTVDPDKVILNPNKVLRTVTPFRLRQEAVLTGVLLHEAAHARHSIWMPHSKKERDALRLSDGSEVSDAVFRMSTILEEPRVETRLHQATPGSELGDILWTMRASSTYLLPLAIPESKDPAQRMMDLLSLWILKVGREYGSYVSDPRVLPSWVNQLTTLVRDELHSFTGSTSVGFDVSNILTDVLTNTEDMGSFVLDAAKKIIDLVFPETATPPMPSGSPCSGSNGTGLPENDLNSESGGSSSTTEPGKADDSGEDSAPGGSEDESAQDQALQKMSSALQAIQQAMEKETRQQKRAAQQGPASESTSKKDSLVLGAGAGPKILSDSSDPRPPSKTERKYQASAERFLRDLIDPSESSEIRLSESPAATVDGAALSSWRAGGSKRAPRFFKRSKRVIEPSPPIKIAILVDISGSMAPLQYPSAVLSWALAAAAQDLSNFAGRGRQIETTMIHWGDTAQVVQPQGMTPRGIREAPCRQGTSAMHEALALVEDEIPGFFEPTDKPENRLLVQFTDWGLSSRGLPETESWIHKALMSGVNMVTVAPGSYVPRWGRQKAILSNLPMEKRSGARVCTVNYDPSNPLGVWEDVAKELNRNSGRDLSTVDEEPKLPPPFPGF